MKHFIFIVIILPTIYIAYRLEGAINFFNLGTFLQAFVPLLVLSLIFLNKNLAYIFNISFSEESQQNNKEYIKCLDVVKDIQRLSIYLSIIYWLIYIILPLYRIGYLQELTPFTTAFRITLYLCLFNFLILLPLEAKLKIKLASEE